MNTSIDTLNAQQTAAVEQTAEICSRISQLRDGCCIFNVVVSGACGEKSLPKVKIELDGEQLDSDAIKGSTIQWFPKSSLNFVSKASQRVSRIMSTYGVKWGDMTIVPLQSLQEMQIAIEAVVNDFQNDLDDLIINFDDLLYEHHMANPTVSHIMRKFTMQKDEFRGRFSVKVLPPVAFTPLGLDDEAEGEAVADDILANFYNEVAKMANDIHEKSFFTVDASSRRKRLRTRANQRIRSGYRTLMEKLAGLAFLDPNINRVIESTQAVLDRLPKSGWIEGADLDALARWTLVISDVDQLKNHSSNDVVVIEEEEVIEDADDWGVLHESNSNNLDEELSTVTAGTTETVEVESSMAETAVETKVDTIDDDLDFGFGF